jgi:hypothetical protein
MYKFDFGRVYYIICLFSISFQTSESRPPNCLQADPKLDAALMFQIFSKKNFQVKTGNPQAASRVCIYLKIVGVQSRNKCSLWNVERKE